MKSKTKRHLRVWITVLIAAVTVVVIGWRRAATHTESADRAQNKAETASDVVVLDEQQQRQISTAVVKSVLVSVDRKATGKLGFNEDRLTPVFTPYSGRVSELLANKGDTVKAGQALVVMDSPDYIAAQNDLASARSELAKARIGLTSAEVTVARARGLHDQEAIATKDLQQTEADFARAQDEVRRTEATVAAVENRVATFGKDPQEIAGLGERVDRRVVLRAPITGMIVERKIGPGQYIKPDSPDPLFLISDLTTLWVLVDVYESDLAAIRLNLPAEITVAAYPGRAFPARISFISPTVDAATRTVRVRCLVPNSEGLLKPEMFATIKIGALGKQVASVVPADAVIADGEDSIVFIAEGSGRFLLHRIQVGHEVEGRELIVDAGLHGGESVAVRGSLLLNELRKTSGK
jgi:cobalt-zinc-cadmium efflux system membrane fusion protein